MRSSAVIRQKEKEHAIIKERIESFTKQGGSITVIPTPELPEHLKYKVRSDNEYILQAYWN